MPVVFDRLANLAVAQGRQVANGILDRDVCVLDKDRTLQIVDITRGDLKAKVSLAKLSLFAPNVDGRGVYAATSDGKLYCVRPLDAGTMTADMLNR